MRLVRPNVWAIFSMGATAGRTSKLRANAKDRFADNSKNFRGGQCAYCEGSLESLGSHIEHFRCRARTPQKTFDWDNLFLSCNRDDSCGRHKDHHARSYDPSELIDPSHDDPDEFLRFRSDGNIDPVATLDARGRGRAEETLRVFNLNLKHGRSLCAERRRVLDVYKGREPDILEALENFSPMERAQFIQEEIEHTAKEPFGTVIRHFLSG